MSGILKYNDWFKQEEYSQHNDDWMMGSRTKATTKKMVALNKNNND